MVPLTALIELLHDTLVELQNLRVADLQFWHRDAARLALVGLGGLALALLVVRMAISRKPGRDLVALPAVLSWIRQSSFSLVRHAAFLPFLVGLPFFAIALADPYTSLIREDVTFPGRRISLMLDASSSMIAPFRAARLNANAPAEATFFTSIAAAEYFVRLRMRSRFRDLMALVEFGDEAYVITPFTHDYENILLSISLIGDPTEWGNFPDKGTIIAQAIDQSVGLFRAFEFLNAAGNVMVIITDGQDSQFTVGGKDLYEILATANETKIPVYMIRVAYNRLLGGNIPDEMWKSAVERTGGKFFAASDESAILRAIHEIDRGAVGRISVQRYSAQQARYAAYGFVAVGLWSFAALLKLAVPYFQKFP